MRISGRRCIWLRLHGVCGVCGALALAAVAAAADQPQWGQRYSRNMVSAEKGLPESFDLETGRGVKWSAALGNRTYSTPVVASGRVLIGTNNERPRDPRHEGDRGVLMCFDEKDGAFCWQLVVPKLAASPYLDWPHTGICSPSTVEGNRVYLVSNRNEILCLDLAGLDDGNDGPYQDEARHMAPPDAAPMSLGKTDADIIWQFDMAGQLGVHPHDTSHSSILVDGPLLYVGTSNGVNDAHASIPAPDAPSLIVLDKATGRLVARDAERMAPRTIHCTWSSPSLGEVNGRPLVFFGGGDGVCYAFAALQAAAITDSVSKLQRVWRFDCDPEAPKENVHRYQDNRREGPSNITGMPVFYRNRVYVAAGGDLWHGKPQAWLKCIDASGTGDITGSGQLWSQPLERHCMSTPSIADGLVFIGDCGRRIHCLDAETGRAYWTQQTRGEIWSSPLVADRKVYVGTIRGDFWVLAAARDNKVLHRIDFGSPIHGTPTAANGVLYIATMDRLYALEQPPGP